MTDDTTPDVARAWADARHAVTLAELADVEAGRRLREAIDGLPEKAARDASGQAVAAAMQVEQKAWNALPAGLRCRLQRMRQ